MLFKVAILLSIIIISCTKYRRRKPPILTGTGRNKTETFFSKVISAHIRYCTDGRVCENQRSKSCHVCEECYCDETCFKFGDCCPDKGLRQSHPPPMEYECVSPLVEAVYPIDIYQSKRESEAKYNMIATCPSEDPDLKIKCFNSSTIPVTSENNKTTFRNMHCALCHNHTEFKEWPISIRCFTGIPSGFSSKAQLINESVHHENCTVQFQAPDGVTERKCTREKDTISQCNVTGLWSQYDEFVERACSSYQTVKEVDNQTYRNPFCFICNTDEPSKIFTQSKCKRHKIAFTPSFTALLDFSDLFRDKDVVMQSKCDSHTVYDPDKDKCRKIFCSYGRELVNDTCQSILGKSRGTGYHLYFDLKLGQEVSLKGSENLLDDLQAGLEEYFKYEFFDSKAALHNVLFIYNTTSQHGNCSDYTNQILFSTDLITVKDVVQDDFEAHLLTLRNISFYFFNGESAFNFTTMVSKVVQKSDTEKLKSNSASCFTSRTIFYDSDTEPIYTPVNGLLFCPQINLEADEFIVSKESGLIVKWRTEPIPADDFELHNNQAKICLSNFKPNSQEILDGKKELSFAESLVSMICTCLSLLCLLITFIIYCIFKSLRSLPGKNNMNLIVTLFLAQLLYLVGSGRTEIPGVCEAMAIFIHYFWLAAFCAMNVCSFHMFRVFTSLRSREDDSDMRRRILQYSIYIYSVPAVTVTITLVSHIVSTNGDKIGYGGAMCFVSSALAIAVAFALPVAVTIVSNSIFFVITLRSIRSRPKIDKNKQDENHAGIYIKLSTLTGITWTIGFLAIITGVQVLSYLFIVINASQGIFLFISFVCNERVKKLIVQQDRDSGVYSRTGTARTNTNTTVSSLSLSVDTKQKPKAK